MRIVGNDPTLSRQITATASGAISAAGKPLIVNTDGTVSLAETQSSAVGASVNVTSGGTLGEHPAITYDSNSNRYVAVFSDFGNSGYGTAVVVSVSGTTCSVGSSVVFSGSSKGTDISIAFDSNANKVLIAYRDQGNSNYGTAVVGTVDNSDNSISFGTPAVFESATAQYMGMDFDSNANKFVIAYRDSGNSGHGTAVVATISGTDVSFGTPVVFNAASNFTDPTPVTFDSSNNKVLISYRDSGNSNYGTSIVGTVSGTAISFGTEAVFESANSSVIGSAFDSSNNKVVIGYRDAGNSGHGTAVVATISSTSVSFGTPVVFNAAGIQYPDLAFSTQLNKVFIVYQDNETVVNGILGTVSGTSISFGSEISLSGASSGSSDSGERTELGVAFNTTDNNFVIISMPKDASSATQVFAHTSEFEKLTTENFIGTSAHSAADGAKVLVNTQGAVDENQSGLTAGQTFFVDKNGALQLTTNVTAALGTASVYESAASSYNAVAYDSNSQRIVVAYQDQGNSSYGTAVVGTVSNSTISFGTPVVFNSGSTTHTDIAFDSSNNKVVIAYQDDGNSSQGTAIVGTVDSSDNSISFGSEAVFNSTTTPSLAITFDNNSNKVVVAYRDQDGSTNYGNAKVGTVSGTSISFGSEATFNSASTANIDMTFDSNSNKVVIAYLDYGDTKGRAVVGTVSGTSISFGSEVLFENADTRNIQIAFDSSNNKIVIAYEDNPNSTYGTAIVGDVDGTSISFGTAVVFNSAATAGSNGIGIGCDSTTGKTLIIYYDQGATDGQYIEGTVSGTSISFGTEATHISSYSIAFDVVEDTTNNKLIIVYQDASNSQYGTAQTYTPSQDLSGSLSHDAVTAGTALSATKLLVKG